MPVVLGSFAVLAIAVLILGSTGIGRIAGRASEHFLLFYAGVFVLLTLTATVMIGLVATDRLIMSPARRVTAQAVHRAVATGSLAFLVIHIVSEIAAQRSQVIDAVIPFLDPGRTFYLGLGTVASDMMVVIAVTGIFRARLATSMSPLAWRVVHCTAYAAWVLGIFHGLLGGRPAKPFFGFSGFVAWSYGACVAGVAVALVVRFVAKDRAAEHTIAQPVPDRPTPLWPAAGGMPALAQAGFGASAPLAVSPARPYQRALTAGDAAATPMASLPAGRGASEGHPQFGGGETRADFGYDDGRGGYQDDDVPALAAEDDPRDAGRDAGYVQAVRGRYAASDTRGGGYPPDDGRGRYAAADMRGGYPQDDDPRGHYLEEDPRASYLQEALRGRYAEDDPRGRYPQDDPRDRYPQDDPRGRYAEDDPRDRYPQDDPRGRYGADEPRGRYGADDPWERYGQDGPRGRYQPDDARGGYPQDDPRDRYLHDDPRGGYGQDDPLSRYLQDDPAGRYAPDDGQGRYAPDDALSRYLQDGPRGRYVPDGTLSRYAQEDTLGRYAQDDMLSRYAQDDAGGGYAQDDMGGRYAGSDMRGDYPRDDVRGRYGQDDASVYYRQDEAPAYEGNFSYREGAGDSAGPLSSAPFSRYGMPS